LNLARLADQLVNCRHSFETFASTFATFAITDACRRPTPQREKLAQTEIAQSAKQAEWRSFINRGPRWNSP
jgi:hypothetical protein